MTMFAPADPRLARRIFLRGSCAGIGLAALASLLSAEEGGTTPPRAFPRPATSGLAGLPHHPPKAKRVIFLCQSGAPSQMELFDYKPELEKRHGEEIPDAIRMGQRLTTMTAEQKSKPLTASLFKFDRHGQCGAPVSELMPHTAKVVDELCFVYSLHTEAINHDPAITFIQTGSQQPGRPSMGSWISYGLGSANDDLPAFVVLISGGQPGDQPLYGRLWGSAFLPGQHQGVKFYGSGDPVLYLSNPPGISRETRRRMLDSIRKLNEQQLAREGDPEIATRIAQYELAFRMQSAVPELADLSREPAATFELYGEDSKQPGTYAANCLLARRLVERGVRFVQLYHRDWDHHKTLPKLITQRSKEVDQPSAALVADLRQRGLLDDTLIIWGGEFGRTAYCQGDLTADDYGRDHHSRCFTMWLAGGGSKRGLLYGKTDDFSYNVVENPVHVHDLQATLLHLLGIDHERLTFRSQGRDFRLTDVAGRVVGELLA
ncbi:MAG TPA: DUF1501 domain-containing protein [Pirellulaceae bacterium]|nr:DUF1501 domain-containing protein [Pirellulaceae bacterium]